MTDPKNTLTARENEVLALAWQCFGADPKYTSSSARFAFNNIKRKLKNMAASVDESNPTPLAGKGGPKRKRPARAAAANDEEGEKLKPKKRGKKTAVPDMLGDEVDEMLGLGKKEEEEAKVKNEPQEMRFGWGAGGEECEENKV